MFNNIFFSRQTVLIHFHGICRWTPTNVNFNFSFVFFFAPSSSRRTVVSPYRIAGITSKRLIPNIPNDYFSYTDYLFGLNHMWKVRYSLSPKNPNLNAQTEGKFGNLLTCVLRRGEDSVEVTIACVYIIVIVQFGSSSSSNTAIVVVGEISIQQIISLLLYLSSAYFSNPRHLPLTFLSHQPYALSSCQGTKLLPWTHSTEFRHLLAKPVPPPWASP